MILNSKIWSLKVNGVYRKFFKGWRFQNQSLRLSIIDLLHTSTNNAISPRSYFLIRRNLKIINLKTST